MGQVVWPLARVATALAITLWVLRKVVVLPEKAPMACSSHSCTAGWTCWHCDVLGDWSGSVVTL